ncbi:uncharacterized protein LOC117101026 [Anneissia japonica]|uniref:uncharacterized protein LOC117101026 n=1 Tax=Anneissia japonica TaxID=1529436 RepID=UPI001425A0F9|nr:uncharacterized protein LOC117101026 [Anneissia japonica]
MDSSSLRRILLMLNLEECIPNFQRNGVCMHKMSTLFITALLLFSVFSVSSAVNVILSVDGHAVEGQQTRLVCIFTRTNSLSTADPLIIWQEVVNSTNVLIVEYQNNTVPVRELHNDRFTVEGGDFRSTLVIHNTKRTDDGTYECEVKIFDDKPNEGSHAVTINVAYLHFSLPPYDVFFCCMSSHMKVLISATAIQQCTL